MNQINSQQEAIDAVKAQKGDIPVSQVFEMNYEIGGHTTKVYVVHWIGEPEGSAWIVRADDGSVWEAQAFYKRFPPFGHDDLSRDLRNPPLV